MLTVRLHLNACPEENGALRVLGGSHLHGRLTTAQTEKLKETQQEVTCCGAVVMRPLILHSSKKAIESTHRRMLHMEFSANPLPHPLQWHEHLAIAE